MTCFITLGVYIYKKKSWRNVIHSVSRFAWGVWKRDMGEEVGHQSACLKKNFFLISLCWCLFNSVREIQIHSEMIIDWQADKKSSPCWFFLLQIEIENSLICFGLISLQCTYSICRFEEVNILNCLLYINRFWEKRYEFTCPFLTELQQRHRVRWIWETIHLTSRLVSWL